MQFLCSNENDTNDRVKECMNKTLCADSSHPEALSLNKLEFVLNSFAKSKPLRTKASMPTSTIEMRESGIEEDIKEGEEDYSNDLILSATEIEKRLDEAESSMDKLRTEAETLLQAELSKF